MAQPEVERPRKILWVSFVVNNQLTEGLCSQANSFSIFGRRPWRRTFVADSSVLDDCGLLVRYISVEHSRLDLAVPLNLYKQPIPAGLRKTVGE